MITVKKGNLGMAKIGFIGVGNMGGPMARNLITAGHDLKVYDLSEEAVNFVVQSGAERAVLTASGKRQMMLFTTRNSGKSGFYLGR